MSDSASVLELSLNWIARAISGITSPFLIVSLMGILSIVHNSDSAHKAWYYAFEFLLTIVGFPLLVVLLGILTGKVSDIHVALREQRELPFLASIMGACLATLMYIRENAPHVLVVMTLVVAANGIVLYLATKIWSKVSMHAASFSGAVVLGAFTISPSYLWLGVFLPVIVWARIKRKRHGILESLIAVALNVLITSGICWLLGVS